VRDLLVLGQGASIGDFRSNLGVSRVYLKVNMSEFVCTSEQEIAIIRPVGIHEFTCFTFLSFSPEITILGL